MAGESVTIRVEGLPPYKDEHFSIRNGRHKIHDRFKALREAAIRAMNGRAPYRGPVKLDFDMHAPALESGKTFNDYTGGIMDTLDGSHGAEFTYLPIVYEDDCQVHAGSGTLVRAPNKFYELRITFVGEMTDSEPPVGGATK
ncbi:MAG TPA: hypothetical protein VN494_08765 [Patescibacteria group bacterium]|nr:hypothetical protein [Patescibacteria group bacterium]